MKKMKPSCSGLSGPLLFMGESDTELYVETITDYVMDVLGLEIRWENEDSKLWEKRVEELRGRAHQASSCIRR